MLRQRKNTEHYRKNNTSLKVHKKTFIRASSKIGNKMKTGSIGVAAYRRPSVRNKN